MYVGAFLGKSIQRKLVCKFERKENIFSLFCNYIIVVVIGIYIFAFPVDAIFLFLIVTSMQTLIHYIYTQFQ